MNINGYNSAKRNIFISHTLDIMLQKILIAISDSPESAEILAAALTLAEKQQGQILLLHVLNPLTPHDFGAVASPLIGGILPIIDDVVIKQYLEEWKKYEQRGMEKLLSYAQQANDRGIKAEVLQKFGDSGPMICDAAKKWSADLIVMGRNQKTPFNEFLLGSNSNYVLHNAFCSVMVIRPSESII
jgi:nucleotide-binding universal stress UspA family protein